MNSVQQLIKEICEELGITFSLVSKNWIILLQKENKVRSIVGYKFDLNNHAAGQICDDKFALYEVLKHENIPVAEHQIVFKNYQKENVFSYAEKYKFDMVVKNNMGTCGNGMVHTTTKEELLEKIEELLTKYESVSLSPYYKIKNEYRTVMLDGNIELFYGKKLPKVIGDGHQTIYELLYNFNPYYFKEMQNSSLNRILKENEVYEYNWQFNLSKGAMPFLEVEKSIQQQVENLARKAAEKVNVQFASIDVIELESGELLVLEINSGVMLKSFMEIVPTGREIAKDIYKKAIEDMFDR